MSFAQVIQGSSGMKRPTAEKSDNHLSRMVTYIPTEIIAGYAAISGFIKTMPPPRQFLWFCVTSLAPLVLTLFYLRFATAKAGRKQPGVPSRHGSIAFAAWGFRYWRAIRALPNECRRKYRLVQSCHRLGRSGNGVSPSACHSARSLLRRQLTGNTSIRRMSPLGRVPRCLLKNARWLVFTPS
jgi:hypothetical protein